MSFDDYIAHGWKLCRIAPGSKGPRTAGWNEPGREETVFPLRNGAGLLHAFSGTMALDIDNYDVAKRWLAERNVDLDELLVADDAVQIVSGRPGSAKLLYACSPRQGKACAPYQGTNKAGEKITKMALDFRCATDAGNSQQDCLPPTMHPDMGRPYEWRFGIIGDWRALPELPAALEAIWTEIATPAAPTAAPTIAAPAAASDDRIQQWLRTQDPNMCRNDWVKVGAKLHAHYLGSQEGFRVWQHWSSTSPKWDDDARSQEWAVWRSFKLEGRPLATLDAEVRQMPAQAEEFPEVVPEHKPAVAPEAVVPALAAELAPELPAHRENRELLQDYVVVQTGSAKPFFLMPGHPIKAINAAAGLAGAEKTYDQLDVIFAPHMAPLVGKKGVPEFTDASEVLKRAAWRREVHRVGFRPGGPDMFQESDGYTYLNAFKPIPVTPIKPGPRDIEPLLWLLGRVREDNGKPIFASWLLRLYAYVLKNPGVKVKWAPLLFSKTEGTGKTTLMQTLPEILFGRQYVSPMVHTVLRERFAGANFDSTWWVALSEMHSDGGKIDARTIANKLKPWITDDKIQIEKKGVDSYSIKNYLQFTAMSNHDDALHIEEGSKERRWLIGQMREEELTTEEKAMLDPLFSESDVVRDPRAASWLHWFFLNAVDLTGFKPNEAPPETWAKRRVREQGHTAWEDEVFEAVHVQQPPFEKDLVMPVDITKRLLMGKNVSIAQAKHLLEKAGYQELEKRFSFARSVYCIRNFERWNAATQDEVRLYLTSGKRPFEEVDDLIGDL